MEDLIIQTKINKNTMFIIEPQKQRKRLANKIIIIEYILNVFKSFSSKIALTVDESNEDNTFTTPHVISNIIKYLY